MSAKKSEMIEALQAKNAGLELDIGDLEKQVEVFQKEVIRMEDRYDEERKNRVRAEKVSIELEEQVNRLTAQVEAAKWLRTVEKRKRHASIPKFVVTSAVALIALMIPYSLLKLGCIDPQTGFGVECVLMMVIAFCYGIIWDRSRN